MRTILAALLVVASACAQTWAGKWFTSEGVLVLAGDGAAITGSYGEGNTLTGKAKGATLTFDYQAGQVRGEGGFELARDGLSFTGEWRNGGNRGSWNGWREEPDAAKGRRAEIGGFWRTSWGLMQLEQKGGSVDGSYGAQGWSTVTGKVEGRRLTLTYTSPFGDGRITGVLRDGGSTLYGSAAGGSGGEWPWLARRLDGFERDPDPKPGRIVSGIGANKMLYHLRAPQGWRRGQPVPAIVFLHGSNMSAKPYLDTIAQRNDFGKRFMIIGVEGEQWSDTSAADDPRHNYTYVNWMGRSTYEGYPNTHRESPALLAELIEELKQRHDLSKVLVGGHSQGGFLSYFMLMHFPELIDGAFPIACGLVIQCEPDVFEDAGLKAAQRRTPLAVVHGRGDAVVSFAQGAASFESFGEYGFPMARMFDNQAGHAFIAVRFDDAIQWLDALSSDDPAVLLAFAQERLDQDGFRDVVAAVIRLRALELNPAQTKRVAELAAAVDEYAADDAERLVEQISANSDATWVDAFLAFRAEFEFADVAAPVMAAYAALRAVHEPAARKLVGEARAAFRNGDQTTGWKNYQQVVDQYYASSQFVRVRRWLAER